MALVGELELASFDYTDPELKGERFHTAMSELAAEGWLAAGPYGYVVLDREAGEFFLRTRSAIFPGMKIAELFDVNERAAVGGDAAQHPARQRCPITRACAAL